MIARIRELETSAAAAGDHAMVLICQIATGEVELDADTTIASLSIATYIAPSMRRRIAERFGTAALARAECERVIGGDK